MGYPEYYNILNVKVDASPEEIKKAYRALVKKYHPDTHKGDKKAEDKLKKINEAYNTLKDLGKRAEYDYHGRQENETKQATPNPPPAPRNTASSSPRTAATEMTTGKYLFRKLFAVLVLVGYVCFLQSNADSRDPHNIVLMLENSSHKIHSIIKNTAKKYQDASWRTDLIYLTVKIGNTNLLKWSLKHLIDDASELNNLNHNPLTAASSPQLASLLLDAGADINYVDSSGETALVKAVREQNTELVQLLLKAGANTDVSAADGSSLISMAMQNNNHTIFNMLMKNSKHSSAKHQ